jgi:hypothetical protein
MTGPTANDEAVSRRTLDTAPTMASVEANRSAVAFMSIDKSLKLDSRRSNTDIQEM